MRPLPFSERTPIPVIPYVSNGVGQTLILHTPSNGYRCGVPDCPCHAEAELHPHGREGAANELHDQIRALRLPDYPQARIYTDILGVFSTETRIVVYLADRPIFTMVITSREELKYMLEDGSLIDLLTQKTAYFLKRQEAERRAMEGDTGKMARMEREWNSPKCEDAR